MPLGPSGLLVRGRPGWKVSRPDRYQVTQSLKAAAAASLAWALTGWWLEAPMALMAPWAAVALVQGTVYRSMRSGVQQILMITAGTLIAAGAAVLTGNTMAAMVIALPAVVLLGNCAPVGEQGLYAPTTALFVLAYGSYSLSDIGHRLLETLVGAAVGIAVNALVLPPVHSYDVQRLMCCLPRDCADLLHRMADDIDGTYDESRAADWYDRAGQLHGTLAELRTARGWASESFRFNPGHKFRRGIRGFPSAEWDIVWNRVSDRLMTLTLTLLETAAEGRRLPPPPQATLGELRDLLSAAGEVCGVDQSILERGTDEDGLRHRRALQLERAWQAHARMKETLIRPDPDTTAAVGSLVADTQALLDDLAPDTPEETARHS